MTAIHGLRLTVLAPLSFSIVLAVLVVQKFTPSDAKDFRLGIVILALAQSFMAGIEFVFSGEPALWGYGRYANGSEVMLSNPFLGDEVVRTQGTLGHPIVLATLLVVALLIVALGNDIRPMVIRVGIASILAISIVLTGTRSAILALVISIVIVKVFRRNAQNRWRNIVVVGSISCAVLFFDFGLRALWNNLERSGSYTNRLGSLQAVPDIFGLPISRIFLGGGFGSESQLYRQGLLQQNGFGIVDNQIVTTMVTGGLFGLMMLFSVLVFAYRKADQLHMAILTSLVIMMFSFDFLKWPTTSLIFFVFCAMAVIERSPHTLLASVDPKERNENTKVR
ncbi:O-antigen ligase family protein [Rhodococcus sp. IEGM 1366]|uniref:O-antigen ligase family protein n=1 Tax=Rhodococcus sp. IEGM 1366 TaxID=3082223 RepID=UPI002952F69C|nr:O-antigen ligase family protein [Rhodococcus sp. IEGM 1366]MDV8069615.1 O-antigen ligase family protein [Rhodococcus sp. IEGM 1366]